MNFTITNILIILFLFTAGCSNSSLEEDKESFLLCYNKEFGDRFSLSQDRALDLSRGLLAIGFGQSNREGMRLYLYLDSSLDIYSPKKHGDFFSNNRYHNFLDFNEADQGIYTKNSLNLFNRVLIQSKSLNHSDEGYISSAEPVFIKKDTLPGITLVAIQGFIPPVFERENGPIEILFQKNNTGDTIFFPNGPVDDERVYRFDIPIKMTEQIIRIVNENSITPAAFPIEVHYP